MKTCADSNRFTEDFWNLARIKPDLVANNEVAKVAQKKAFAGTAVALIGRPLIWIELILHKTQKKKEKKTGNISCLNCRKNVKLLAFANWVELPWHKLFFCKIQRRSLQKRSLQMFHWCDLCDRRFADRNEPLNSQNSFWGNLQPASLENLFAVDEVHRAVLDFTGKISINFFIQIKMKHSLQLCSGHDQLRTRGKAPEASLLVRVLTAQKLFNFQL